MITNVRVTVALVLIAVALFTSPIRSYAQSFPSGPITIYMPGTAGSIADTTIRRVTKNLSDRLGWKFVIEAKPGAGGTVAALALKNLPPTGYTLLYSHSGSIVQDGLLLLNMPFDAERDLRPVSGVYNSVNFLVVPATLQVSSIGQLVEYSKKKAGGVNFGSYGAVTEIMAAVLMRETGMKATSIGYKGAVPALIDLLGGRIDMLYTSLALIEGPLNEGKLRAIAVTGHDRFSGRRDVPTFLEQGVPLTESFGWWGLFARSGTPDSVIRVLHAEFTKTLQDEEIRRAMIQGGSIPIPTNAPEEFATWIGADRSKTERLVRSIGMPRQ